MKIIKFILTLLAVVTPSHAQGGNSVYQLMLNGVTTLGASVPVRNIGQQYSLLAVKASEIATTSCATFGWSGVIQLEASYDNTTYFAIGSPITFISNGQTITTSAPGAFSYIRVDYLNGTVSTCKLTAYYSGTVTGTPIGSSPYSAFSEQFIYQPFVQNVMAPTVIASCTIGRVVVYALTLSNVVNSANTVTFAINNTTAPRIATTFSTDVQLAPYATYTLPNGPRPYMKDSGIALYSIATDAETLTLALTAATNVTGTTVFRCE